MSYVDVANIKAVIGEVTKIVKLYIYLSIIDD